MKTKSKFLLSSFAFILFLVLSLFRSISGNTTGDFFAPLCEAQALIDKVDPFDGRCTVVMDQREYPTNPITTALVAIPFLPFGAAGSSLLWAMINCILVYAILTTGQYWRLIIFLSAPYWIAFEMVQWSPLILAIAFLPDLLPLALVKPHIAIPVFMQNITRKRFFLCLAFGLFSLAFDPTWPLRWWKQASVSLIDAYIPLLVFPVGLLLPLILLRWRDRRAQFLAWMCITPQRWAYDLVLLWFVPETKRQMLILTFFTWPIFGLLHIEALKDLHYYYPIFNVVLAYYPLIMMMAVIPVIKRFLPIPRSFLDHKSSQNCPRSIPEPDH